MNDLKLGKWLLILLLMPIALAIFAGDRFSFIWGRFFSIQRLYFLLFISFPRAIGTYIWLAENGLSIIQDVFCILYL